MSPIAYIFEPGEEDRRWTAAARSGRYGRSVYTGERTLRGVEGEPMEGIVFGGWDGAVRVVVAGILAYASIVVLVRVSGKRTLASMNAFDFIVNIALGSLLASLILSRDVPIVDGVAAFLVLLGLQFAVS